MSQAVCIVVTLVLVVHGVIHGAGFAKAFHLAELAQLTRPIARWLGVFWFVTGLLVLGAAALLPLEPRWGWVVGAIGLVCSQALVFSNWGDAKLGTLANAVLLLAVGYAFAAYGPWSLRAQYEDRTEREESIVQPATLLNEADLATLPEPVRRYIRAAGVLGRPRVHNLRATWTGRIRSGPTDPWMSFTAEQVNTIDPPRRYFFMNAVMKGLPVDVLHAFDEAGATMRVRLLAVKTMVDARGEVLTRAETVTLFNDLCLLAPGELVRSSITWETIDAHTVVAHYSHGANIIAATLTFNDAAELVEFRSEDRSPSPDGTTGAVTWTTPVRDYAIMGPARVFRHAETVWHPDAGAWTYGEFTLTRLAYNVARASR